MKKRVKILLIIGALFLLCILTASLVFSHMARRLETYLSEVEITPVNLEQVADGTYSSRINTGVIIVELEVDIADHSIRDIRLIEHRNGRGSEAEKIIPRILGEQRIDVDTISGATYSSLVIQDALIKALE